VSKMSVTVTSASGKSATVTSYMFGGKVTHDSAHPDDGGGWHVGHVDWWESLMPFEDKIVRVTIELVEAND
jgi:hypothetical protein